MQKTFLELTQLWIQSKQPLIKQSSMCAYRLMLKTHLLPYFGGMTEIKEHQVQEFIIHKIRDGLAKKTVRDIVALLKMIVRYGARHDIYSTREWVLEYPKIEERERLPTLSLRHQKTLMSHLITQPNVRSIGILLALCTGMRIGEVCALRWEDIDLSQRIITVKHTLGRIYNCDLGKTAKVISSPKTKHSTREIPISKQLFEALCTIKRLSGSDFVVGCSQQGLDPRTYRDYFYRLLRRLRIPKIVFHGLRHTFATRCIESQCDYKTISSILGHSNIATTLNLYVHPNLLQKKRCIEKMSKFIDVGS